MTSFLLPFPPPESSHIPLLALCQTQGFLYHSLLLPVSVYTYQIHNCTHTKCSLSIHLLIDTWVASPSDLVRRASENVGVSSAGQLEKEGSECGEGPFDT